MSTNPDLVMPSRPRRRVSRSPPAAGREIDRATPSMRDHSDELSVSVRDQERPRGIQPPAKMASDRFGSTGDYLEQVASEFRTLRDARTSYQLTGWSNATPADSPARTWSRHEPA